MSQSRRPLRPLLSESAFSDPPDDVTSRKNPHRPLPSNHHHPPPDSQQALTSNTVDKDCLSRTLARAMNTLDHNRDDDWYCLTHGSLPKCPQNTDPQTGRQLPTAKTKLFFNHVQTPSSSSSSPSPPAFPTRRFHPIPHTSTQSSPYFDYLDHLPAMAGPIRTKDVVDSRPPSASGSNTASTTAGPSSSSRPSKSKNPPRPLNAWIIYRKQMLQELLKDPENKRLPQSELSKKISTLWKSETDESRARFEYEANLSKAQHQKDYPDYQFRPRKRADKERERAERKEEMDRERAERRLAKLNKRAQSSNATPATAPPSAYSRRPSSSRPSTSQLPQAPTTSSTDPQNVHSFMVQRYGVCGPSPPLSQAPSPYGSPVMEGFSLDAPQDAASQELTEHDASFSSSRYASGSTSVAPEVGATRQPSVSREQAVPVAHPRPVIPIRPPTTTGWHSGVPPRSAVEASTPSQQHTAVAQVGTGTEGDGAMWAHNNSGYVNGSESQSAVYDALGAPKRDVLQRWITDTNHAVNGGYEYAENTGEDASTLAYAENTYNPNIFALEVDTAALSEMPPGEIRVSPSNPYASVAPNLGLPSTSFVPDNVLGMDLSQIPTSDLEAFSNFFTNYTAQENALKDELFGENGIEGLDMVTSGGSANVGFDGGFDFALGFDPNVPLPDFANDGFTGLALEIPNAQFVPTNEEYDFGLGVGLVNNHFGILQTNAGPSTDEHHVLDRSVNLQQSQLLPTPPDTESSPTSAGSTGEKRGQNSPVDLRPRSYMPPPGALNASMRRAAGTWRPPANLLDDDE